MHRRHLIGSAAFDAEMQMRPRQQSFALSISPKDVLRHIGDIPEGQIPDAVVFVCAATDLNVSYAATTAILGYERDMTAHVLAHFLTPCHVD